MRRIWLALLLLLTACAPAAAAPVQTAQVIKIHASAASQPWLAQAYQCADNLSIILQTVNDPQQTEISLRLGEPETLSTPAFQIGQDDLLVVTRSDSPIQNLTPGGVQELFGHPEAQNVQLWVFSSGEDIQQVFTREVLLGRSPSSFARVATSPRQMSDSLGQDKNAVGLLPRRLKTDTLKVVFSLPNVPVIAILNSEPQGSMKSLLACLQK